MDAALAKLVETLAAAGTGLFAPYQMKRIARARAQTAKIDAASRLEISEIEERARLRAASTDLRRQKNIEAISEHAACHLASEVSDDPVDADWVSRFFGACEDIGSPDMQLLWGKLLAGEVARPGSFSFRTIETVRNLQRFEADLFTRLSSFVWMHEEYQRPVLVVPLGPAKQHIESSVSYEGLISLAVAGLLYEESGSRVFLISKQPAIRLRYFEDPTTCVGGVPSEGLQLRKLMLTRVGEELQPIAGGVRDHAYKEVVLQSWAESGYQIWTEQAQ